MSPTFDAPQGPAWIAPSAEIYGDIRLADGVSVWPRVVCRAESQFVSVGRCSNVQDFVMLHVGARGPTVIGAYCSITHHATVHGAQIGDHCLVGINATLMDGAVLGRNSIVAGHTIVTEGTIIPPNSIVAGVPGKVVAQRNSYAGNKLNAFMYFRNAQAYAVGNYRLWADAAFAEERDAAARRFELESASQ
jgi:carbonic anhydrase/acetyltransferase-like protein (isoleucine patch superfamily)